METIQVSVDETIRQVLIKQSNNPDTFGMSIVVDNNDTFLGVLTLGDISKSLVTNSPEDKVSNVYNKNAFYVTEPIEDKDAIIEAINQCQVKGRRKRLPRFIPVLSKEKKVVRIINTYEILSDSYKGKTSVSIYGMGFVGLTLGLSLAKVGFEVEGIDVNSSLIENLNSGKCHIKEPRITQILRECLRDRQIRFATTENTTNSSIHIICVGTPVKVNNEPNMSYITECAQNVALKIKKKDLVIIRSTVSVGTTRHVILPIIEKFSGLKAGYDFHLSFSPERTIQGNAMEEIEKLPQLVSGYSKNCLEECISFWRNITDSVIQLESLEAAELAKLANNTYRDINFSFSNGLSQICHSYNIDANKLIQSLNEGYERSNVPRPSPGVGGYCLSKDPHILASSDSCNEEFKKFIKASRAINTLQSSYLASHWKKYCLNRNIDPSSSSIIVIGLAFKGVPATNDLRHSPSIDFIEHIKDSGVKIYGFDEAIEKHQLDGSKVELIENKTILRKKIPNANGIFILNNNPKNLPDDLLELISERTLVCDPWNFYREHEIKSAKKIAYATLGRIKLIDD